MKSQIAPATGYAAVLIPPALLALSAWIDEPLLALGTVLLLLPLARMAFGGCSSTGPAVWDERIALVLHHLPLAYLIVLCAALGAVLESWVVAKPSPAEGLQWAMSLWVSLVFATCVAHELVHRQGAHDRWLGHLLAGLAGYPVLGYEHLLHHRLAGRTASAEWPLRSESVWQFAKRRVRRIATETLGRRGLAWHGSPRSPTVFGLRLALAATTATGAIFGVAGGWVGLATYVLAAVLVVFSMQLITYMQHWGLGDDCMPDAHEREWAWEDDCRFQGWITLNLSLHQTHHANPARPYFLATLSPESPRLPSGYVVLMFAAFVPRIWQRVMNPALTYWIEHPSHPPSPGRRVTCAAIYRHR